jgi:DNA modification methylase
MDDVGGAGNVKPYLEDADFTLYNGDSLEVLRTLPDESVQMCCTSPPFFGLRSYLDDEHEDKPKEIGLEATPEEWVAALVAVFEEVRRVLRKDGVCFVELGDSYQDKQLLLQPFMFAFAMKVSGWILRNVCIFSRPNPMPESVRDRFTVSHSYVLLFSKSPRYYFDAEAVREPHTAAHIQQQNAPLKKNANGESKALGKQGLHDFVNPAGRNARSVWTIPTQPLPFEHYAAFPEALAKRCIKAGTSERGCCPECGAPWVRLSKSGPDPRRPQAKRALEIAEAKGLTEQHIEALQACGISDVGKALVTTNGAGKNAPEVVALAEEARAALGGYAREFLIRGTTETIGWRPSCECNAGEPIPCTVADVFMGSGTTALVARRLGRRCIGVELSRDYCALSARRTQQLSLEASA